MKLAATGILLFAPLLLRLADCGGNPAVGGWSVFGEYSYKGYDSLQRPIVTGSLTLERIDSTHFRGRWHLIASDSISAIGPQTGTGQLAGTFGPPHAILINLNPGVADNNVFLQGVADTSIFLRGLGEPPSWHGTWEWSTFVGRTNYGTFVAAAK